MSSTPPAASSPLSTHAAVRGHARRLFDRWARTYDRSWLHELVFSPAIRICQEEIARWQTTRRVRPYRLLDVGCGTGTLLTVLAGQPDAERLVGLDYSPAMAGRAAAKIVASPSAAKLDVAIGDAERLPFADASFDIVTCCHSFHHYPHQPAAVQAFFRVLRPGGLLILVDGFRDSVVGWVVFDVGVALVESHVHHAAWSQVRDMIEAAGFATLRQRKVNILAPLLISVATR